MRTRHRRREVPLRVLFANPLEKCLKLRRPSQRLDRPELLHQLGIRIRRVKLLMTRLAQRRPMLGLAPLLPGREMMLRDQPPRHAAPAQLARDMLFNFKSQI
jgi:hypothetical protein